MPKKRKTALKNQICLKKKKKSNQTTIRAGTDEARPKNLKMQVIVNTEINSKEKSITNLDLKSNLDTSPIALPTQDQALSHRAVCMSDTTKMVLWLSAWSFVDKAMGPNHLYISMFPLKFSLSVSS